MSFTNIFFIINVSVSCMLIYPLTPGVLIFSLLLRIDDIEDGSVLRRGIPVAHSVYGVASTINSANYVYFLGLQKTLALGHPRVKLNISNSS